MTFCGEMMEGIRMRNRLDFGGDSDSFVDPGSFFQDSLPLADRACTDTLRRVCQQISNGFRLIFFRSDDGCGNFGGDPDFPIRISGFPNPDHDPDSRFFLNCCFTIAISIGQSRIQERPAVADKPARRLRNVCTVYVRAVGL